MNNTDDPGLIFLKEPFEIPPENRLVAYRYNIGKYSPWCNLNQSWCYDSKAVKTNNPIGIYAMQNRIHAIMPALHILYRRIFEDESIEIVFLELEINKLLILDQNESEISFTQCNIIEKLSIDQFIDRVYPELKILIYWYHMAIQNPSNNNKLMFSTLLDAINLGLSKLKTHEDIKSGRHITIS